jgi:hypothetical protein
VAPRADTNPSASIREPYREFIESELAKRRNAMANWKDWWTAASVTNTPA